MELIEGKVDWKGRPAQKDKHGGSRTSLLILGSLTFESMATFALAVNLVTYFTGVMHFDVATSANQLTNYMGTSYIVTIAVATLADTYIGRFKAVLLATSIEFLVRILAPQLLVSPIKFENGILNHEVSFFSQLCILKLTFIC